jgi:hypothetical protein
MEVDTEPFQGADVCNLGNGEWKGRWKGEDKEQLRNEQSLTSTPAIERQAEERERKTGIEGRRGENGL